MLERLVKFKDVCEDKKIQGDVYLSQTEWDKITELIKALEFFKKASKKMQKVDSSFTDLYKILQVLNVEIREAGTIYLFLKPFTGAAGKKT